MLVVYKGYEKEFLEREKDKRLVDTEIENKINISKTLDKVSKEVMAAITQNYTRLMNEDLWITYEELIKVRRKRKKEKMKNGKD